MGQHHPPHVYLDTTWYMVTASTCRREHLLRPAGHKELVRDQLKALLVEFNIRLTAWVILDNHYHLLVRLDRGASLPRFIARLHGRTSYDLNSLDGTRGRQVWHNYWDTCIRGEADYWRRFNYIHYNPVKHAYVRQAEDWCLSSYRYYLEHKGHEWLAHVAARYPVADFTDLYDDFTKRT